MGPTGPGSMSAISRGPNQGQASGTPGQPSGMQRSALGTTQLGQDAMLGQASKRRRPAIDRHLPLFFPQDNGPTKESDEVLANLRESYTSLEALEKKMDWTISRKRAEYSDLTGRSGTQMGQSKSKMGGVRRTLRLWLSHEIHTNSTTQESTQDQPENNDSTEQKEDNGSNDTVDKEQPESTEAATESQHKDPSWTLKLTGLLQQNEDEEKTHLSSLLSQLVVEVAPQDTPNQQRIEVCLDPLVLNCSNLMMMLDAVEPFTGRITSRWSYPLPTSHLRHPGSPQTPTVHLLRPTSRTLQTSRTSRQTAGHLRRDALGLLAGTVGLHQKARVARE